MYSMRLNFRKEISIAIFIFIAASLTLFLSPTVYAHQSGCHRWHSCPSDSGSYSCGDTGYSNYCGSSITQKITPVITYKDEITYEDIPLEITKKDNLNEYVGYTKLITQGSNGKKKISANVTYTDGVETNRGDSIKTIESNKVNSVYSIGTRKKPSAYIDYIWDGDPQYFLGFKYKKYDVSAAAQPNENFALIKNGEVIKLDKSDASGSLIFDNIELKNGDKISIGTYSGSQILWFMPTANQISEISSVNIDKLDVISEYDKIHNKTSDRTNNSIKYTECPQDIKDKYLKSLKKWEKDHFETIKYDTVYYTEIPCTVKNEKK